MMLAVADITAKDAVTNWENNKQCHNKIYHKD